MLIGKDSGFYPEWTCHIAQASATTSTLAQAPLGARGHPVGRVPEAAPWTLGGSSGPGPEGTWGRPWGCGTLEVD